MSEGVGKFSAGNGEAKVDVPTPPDNLVGLSKAEVMKFASDPVWVMLRRTLFFLFWAIWIAMLVGAIFIVIITPKCQKEPEAKWFEKSPIYTVRVDSFADSNGDGAGDLAGIIEKLPYIKNDISIDAVALEGLLERTDLMAIRPQQGSESDLKNLASQIKVILKIPVLPDADIDKILKKWTDLGVNGFILEEFDNLNTQHFEAIPRWKQLITNSTASPDPMLLALSSLQFFDLREEGCKHADMVLNHDMMRLPKTFTSTALLSALTETHRNASKCRSNFVLGMAISTALATRFEPRSLRESLLLFNMLSDATPIVYYGDEYGKLDSSPEVKPRNLVPLPDASTGPMDWDDLHRVKTDPNPNFYKVFAAAAKLRKNEASILKGLTSLRESDSVLSMSRVKIGNPGFVVVSNFATETKKVNLLTTLSRQIPEDGTLSLTSTNSKRALNSKLKLSALSIEPGETLVIQFIPEK